jgi:hypothetical protein
VSTAAELIRVIRRSDIVTSRVIVCGCFPDASLGDRRCHSSTADFSIHAEANAIRPICL